MKKIIILCMIAMNIVTVDAINITPTYKIVADSNEQSAIEEMYTIKNQLLDDYSQWVKGVDDYNDALIDHQYVYNATYYNGIYEVILGDGQGKVLTGKLQTNYCTTTQEIKKTSWLQSLFQ